MATHQRLDDPSGKRFELLAEGLLTLSECSQFMRLSRSSLYALMDRGELLYVRIGRARRIPRRALLELAAANLSGGLAHQEGERGQ